MATEKFPEVVNDEKCILIVGNPMDGLITFGPFDTFEDAFDYAETVDFEDTWWVHPLIPVQCDEDGNWILDEEHDPDCDCECHKQDKKDEKIH